MGLISFIADAGEKLLSTAHAVPAAAPASAAAPNVAQLNATAGEAIAKYIASQQLSVQNLKVAYDGASKTVTVTGVAPDQATKEKIVLCCGNVHSVAKVDDQMTAAQSSSPAATMYDVKEGDTLTKIAKSVYGDPNRYEAIFEANKPMLTDPIKSTRGSSCGSRPKLKEPIWAYSIS